jgi:hypothetical protein
MVYIYAVEAAPKDAAPHYIPARFAQAETADEDESKGSVRIYSMKITETKTALEDILGTQSSSSAIKVLRNGEVFIIRDGKIFNLFGTELN